MFDLKTNGDSLEKEYYDIIIKDFPTYKDLWESIVGNDGNNQIPIYENKSEFYEKRLEFSQLSYTILESFISLHKINQEVIEITDFETYFESMNSFILFFAHFGRIVDCFRKMPFNMKDNFRDELKNLYEKRNNVLHGKKVPFRVTDNLLEMPEISDLEIQSTSFGIQWTDKLKWGQVMDTSLKLTNDIFNQCYEDIKNFLNDVYPKFQSVFMNSYSNEMRKLKSNILHKSSNLDVSLSNPYPSGSILHINSNESI